MAVTTKNSSGTPLSDTPRCPGSHVDIIRYDLLLNYLIEELEGCTAEPPKLSSEALIECLVKHRELISGPNVWSPRARAYVRFDERTHGTFAVLKPSGPTVVRFLAKLMPVYCRLCLMSDCHDGARAAAQSLLVRLTGSRGLGRSVLADFEIRALEYMRDNLLATPPSEWGDVCRSSDVSADTKISVELLWSHLVLVYAGHRKLLLCNVELFFTKPQDSLNLCPGELRAALFVHGKHDPFSQRKERCRGQQRVSHARRCPVLPLGAHPRARRGADRRSTAITRLYESRVSRLCWLAALWILDIECNRGALHWLYKPEPHRL